MKSFVRLLTFLVALLSHSAVAQMNVNWTPMPDGTGGDTYTQKWTMLADPAGMKGYWSWHHQLMTTNNDKIYVGPQWTGTQTTPNTQKRVHYFSFWADNRTAYRNVVVTAGKGFDPTKTVDNCDGVAGPCVSVSLKSSDNDWQVAKEYEYMVTLKATSPGRYLLTFAVRNLTDDSNSQYTGVSTPWVQAGTVTFESASRNLPVPLLRYFFNANENGVGNGCNPVGTGSIVRLGHPSVSLGSKIWEPKGSPPYSEFRGTDYCTSPLNSFKTAYFADIQRVVTVACGDGGFALARGSDDISCAFYTRPKEPAMVKPTVSMVHVHPSSCRQLLQLNPNVLGKSGLYSLWLPDSEPGKAGFPAWCDMTDYVGSGYPIGNGWTLVGNQASSGNWIAADLNFNPDKSFGVFPGSWDKTKSYYVPHSKFSGGPNRVYLFRTGDMKQWCAAKASDLTAANTDTQTLNVTIQAGDPRNTPSKTNSLFRPGTLEDPWFGCGGSHAQNDAAMFWGENGSNGHLSLKNSHQGIGLFVRE